ncbi:Threonylcarbamoyl-AMP synthase [Buchnera aphidicola (Eriosoma lanigerum)]|uniref:Sua5/YciO/YrdC/YwlC family protein n=1 Tax=Buchnera aphidicola TaxID=9 RepID=UPI003463FFA7
MFNNVHNINYSSVYTVSDVVNQLNKKKIIAYPTESVFSLGCDPDSKSAIFSLIKLKNRNINKGFILIAAHYDQLKPYILEKKILLSHKKILSSYWPGHKTFLLPANDNVPYWLNGNSSFIATRITNHKVVKNLCSLFGKPIISTSANLTGLLPCRTVEEFYKQFGKNIMLLRGPLGINKKPSSIFNLITGEIVRYG